jgi:hypothetical protein
MDKTDTKLYHSWGEFLNAVPLAKRIEALREDDDDGCEAETTCWDYIGTFGGSYSSAVDADMINVLRGIRDGLYNTEIADKYEMAPTHVEFIQYQICGSALDLVDYGTSPRGCYDNTKGALSEFIAMFEDQYEREWKSRHD